MIIAGLYTVHKPNPDILQGSATKRGGRKGSKGMYKRRNLIRFSSKEQE